MGPSLVAFALFAAALTVTPGLDTMLVLRTTAIADRRAGSAAIAGIGLGCLVWAVAGAVGVTAVVSASRFGFDVLRLAGGGYLGWLGVRSLWRARSGNDRGDPARPVHPADAGDAIGDRPVSGAAAGAPSPGRATAILAAFRTGLASNLLNPKVGAFYLSVLPQFLPHGVNPLAGALALGSVHVAEGVLWLSLVMLAVVRARGWLRRPAVRRRLEQATGLVFLALGLRLAVERVPT